MIQKTLKLLSKNLHGLSISFLVCEIQDTRLKLELLDITPNEVIGFQQPSEFTQKEWIEDHRYFWNSIIDSDTKEIERRRHINETYVKNPDLEIIQTIKERIKIEDVLEWYTEVLVSKRQWKYRCTLHGPDKHPSGIIYQQDNKCWCFVCNQGGDVFDTVQLFERINLPQAIAKLATHIGIDTKSLTNSTYTIK